MKKTYELVQVNVISLGNDDVITASAARSENGKKSLLGGSFDFGDFNVQDFS